MRKLCLFIAFLIFAIVSTLLSLSPASAQDNPTPTDEPINTGVQVTIEPLQPLTLQDTESSIDAWLTDKIADIRIVEDQYFITHDSYWQALKSDTADPSYSSLDLNNSPSDIIDFADNLASMPSDGAYSWADMLPQLQSESLPAALQVDIYAGPQGQGYVVIASFSWDGTTYSSAHQFGPETWRDQAWAEQ